MAFILQELHPFKAIHTSSQNGAQDEQWNNSQHLVHIAGSCEVSDAAGYRLPRKHILLDSDVSLFHYHSSQGFSGRTLRRLPVLAYAKMNSSLAHRLSSKDWLSSVTQVIEEIKLDEGAAAATAH
jgi:hypothetical protein